MDIVVLSALSHLTSGTPVIQRQLKPSRLCSSGPSDGTLLLFTAYYLILSVVLFPGFIYVFVLKGLPTEDPPFMVAGSMLLAYSVWLCFYIGFKIFSDIFRDVLWRMRPLLHYSFQDFTESVRDSIESYNY